MTGPGALAQMLHAGADAVGHTGDDPTVSAEVSPLPDTSTDTAGPVVDHVTTGA
ncbi:MAG TPA: hypothetical protein VGN51_09340 [Acidimicrobiia bacterium]